MTPPEDIARLENDYLGDQPLPTNLAVLGEELSKFLTVTEIQVGWMNAVSAEGFLNEQTTVYQSPLFRWITKALRERNTSFIRDLAKVLANSEHPALMSKTARQLIQSASALSQRGDPVAEAILDKLRNSEWLARASLKKIRVLGAKLAQRSRLTRRIFEKPAEAEIEYPDGRKAKKAIKVQRTEYDTGTAQKTSDPKQADVVKHWEGRTGKSREEINVPREMRAARLELPKGKSGRPRRKKRSGS